MSNPLAPPLPHWLTTDESATYCRLGSASSTRSLFARGELQPDGRAGRRGKWLSQQETLDT